MTTDALLAVAHHLTVFGLLAVLAAEWGIVRPGLTRLEVDRLRRFDLAYGVLAGLVLVAGMGRVVLGAKPHEFYLENPIFWLKMISFAGVGLLSVRPTILYMQWSRDYRSDSSAEPADAHVKSVRRTILAQLFLFPLLPALGAVMARGTGL